MFLPMLHSLPSGLTAVSSPKTQAGSSLGLSLFSCLGVVFAIPTGRAHCFVNSDMTGRGGGREGRSEGRLDSRRGG